MLTQEDKTLIDVKKKSYPNSKAAIIEVLKIVQNRMGWLSDQSIINVAKILDLTVAEVESVATFYSQIFRKPVGRNIIKYCDSVVCYIMGFKKVEKVLVNTLNISPGGTTNDNRYTLLPVCCLGNCDKAPTIMVNDDLFSNVTHTSVLSILECYK